MFVVFIKDKFFIRIKLTGFFYNTEVNAKLRNLLFAKFYQIKKTNEGEWLNGRDN